MPVGITAGLGIEDLVQYADHPAQAATLVEAGASLERGNNAEISKNGMRKPREVGG